MRFLPSVVQKSSSEQTQTDGQTDRHTHTQTQLKLLPNTYTDGKQVAFQSNANHPLAESMGYIKFEGM